MKLPDIEMIAVDYSFGAPLNAGAMFKFGMRPEVSSWRLVGVLYFRHSTFKSEKFIYHRSDLIFSARIFRTTLGALKLTEIKTPS